MKKFLLAFALTLVPSLSLGQNFRAVAVGGTLSTHFDSGTGAVIDTAISHSTSTGFTSPSVIVQATIANSTYVGFDIGNVQVGTGVLLSGDINATAHFASGGYVRAGFSSGSTPVYTLDAHFTSNVRWQYTQSGAHILTGVAVGKVNGGANKRYFVSLTTEPQGWLNGHITVASVSVVQIP